MSRWLRIPFILAVAIGALLLIVIASGGANSAAFERYFPVLLVINTFATLTLFALVCAVAYGLIKRWKQKVFGSRMTAYLSIVMSLAAVLPCLLIYAVSSQFIGRSIDSWFDVRVEQALNSGVALSSEVIVREQNQLLATARRIASILNTSGRLERPIMLDRMREASNTASAIVFSEQGEILLSSFSPTEATVIDRPTRQQLEKARSEFGIYLLEGDQPDSDGLLRIRSIVPIGASQLLQPTTFLQLTQVVPGALAEHTYDLIDGFRNYQELVLSRSALRKIYTVTLTLAMLLAVLGAVAVALIFANSTTAPVLQLERGTRKVAEGDLRPIRVFSGKSEINKLTQSFNTMIVQIAEARQNVERQRLEAEQARAHLELIIGTLSSGVIVTDESLRVVMHNTAAAGILSLPSLPTGANLADLAPEFSGALLEKIDQSDEDETVHLELMLKSSLTQSDITIFIRAAGIDIDNDRGWVIVFDDITRILDAQRAVAWGEVARRLAHEIKNPLTPIRLAAERLEFKLTGKLDEKDEELLHRTSRTIVTQVDAMKQMVNDFRDYAKLPEAVLKPMNIGPFLEELSQLYTTAGTKIELHAAADLPDIAGDATQLRQVFHNLIGNAVDATGGKPDPFIGLSADAIVKSGRKTGVRVTLTDNGGGFPASILSKVFEPYATTKPYGTGLGLPMVKKILDEHHAKISIGNRTGAHNESIGAEIVIVFAAYRGKTAENAAQDTKNQEQENSAS